MKQRDLMISLGVGVLLSRVPFLAPGPGTDPDASRVLLAAGEIVQTGRYAWSRPPGFPVHELLVALASPLGEVGANGVSAVASAVAAVAFAAILRRVGVAAWLPLAVAFALTPLVWTSSAVTMDYLPGLALALGATWAALAGRPALAGALLGIAAGARLTHVALAVPIAWWTATSSGGAGPEARDGPRLGRTLAFLGAALGVALMCYAPVLARYGAGAMLGISETSTYPPARRLLLRAGPDVWGTVGVLAVAVATLWALVRLGREAPANEGRRRALLLAVLCASVYALAFLRLPHSGGYLVPAVPFVLLALGLLLPRRGAHALAAALALSSVVHVGRSGISPGPIVREVAVRRAAVEEIRANLAALETLPPTATVVAGALHPALQVAWRNRSAADGPSPEVVYLLLDVEACRRSAARGPVRWVGGAAAQSLEVRGVDLPACGARPLLPSR